AVLGARRQALLKGQRVLLVDGPRPAQQVVAPRRKVAVAVARRLAVDVRAVGDRGAFGFVLAAAAAVLERRLAFVLLGLAFGLVGAAFLPFVFAFLLLVLALFLAVAAFLLFLVASRQLVRQLLLARLAVL